MTHLLGCPLFKTENLQLASLAFSPQKSVLSVVMTEQTKYEHPYNLRNEQGVLGLSVLSLGSHYNWLDFS